MNAQIWLGLFSGIAFGFVIQRAGATNPIKWPSPPDDRIRYPQVHAHGGDPLRRWADRSGHGRNRQHAGPAPPALWPRVWPVYCSASAGGCADTARAPPGPQLEKAEWMRFPPLPEDWPEQRYSPIFMKH